MPYLNNLLTYFKGLSFAQNWINHNSSFMTDFYWSVPGAICLIICFNNIWKTWDPPLYTEMKHWIWHTSRWPSFMHLTVSLHLSLYKYISANAVFDVTFSQLSCSVFMEQLLPSLFKIYLVISLYFIQPLDNIIPKSFQLRCHSIRGLYI